MDTTQRELDTIELHLDSLRIARFKRFHAAMLGILCSAGTIASESIP